MIIVIPARSIIQLNKTLVGLVIIPSQSQAQEATATGGAATNHNRNCRNANGISNFLLNNNCQLTVDGQQWEFYLDEPNFVAIWLSLVGSVVAGAVERSILIRWSHQIHKI